MRFARRLFQFAGWYGLLVLVPQYFAENAINDISKAPISHPEYFYGFIGVAVAWQIMFLLIGRDPLRYRPAMLPAMIEKFSFGLATVVLYLQHRLSIEVLGGGILDLLLGIGFVIAYRLTGSVSPKAREPEAKHPTGSTS